MSSTCLSVINISITVSILFIFFMILNVLTKKKYSAKYKQFLLLLLGIRLLLPINLNMITFSILPEPVASNLSILTTTNQETERTKLNDIKNNLTSVAPAKSTNTVDLAKKTNSSRITVADETMNGNNSHIVNHNAVKSSNLSTNATSKLNSLLNIGGIVWLIGIGLFLFYHLFSYIVFVRSVKRYGKFTPGSNSLLLLEQLKQELGIKKDIQLLIYDKVASPLLVGYINPYIVLPSSEYTETQMTYIIKHELIHYQHHDLYYKLVYVLANAIHWFNPIIYVLLREATCTMELYCDETLTSKQSYEYCKQYSLTLLHMLKHDSIKKNVLLTTSFSNQAKHLKERFKTIMSPNIKKKGTLLLIISAFVIILVSNMSMDAKTGRLPENTMKDIKPSASSNETNLTTSDPNDNKENKKITNILLLGLDVHPNNHSTTDSILLITLNKETKQITVNTFLRDLYVAIPGHDNDKLSCVFNYGQEQLIKDTILTNFDVEIDQVVCVDYHNLETVFDTLGGVTITLSEKETEYLNRTNFISKAKNRNVIAGEQHLNGNQIVGYLRVRYVPYSTGETNDLGRTKRITNTIQALLSQVSKLDLSNVVTLAKACFSSFSTTMDLTEITEYLRTYLPSITTASYTCIPRFEECTQKRMNNRSVIIPDYDKAKSELTKFTK